ncbi:MAG TPA: 2-polyprenylphenol hydroxylase, partial [Magnetococcales bacterium]|nr:2-polyprenylphenol hydroxylase [Magnetococcales bacterium]
MDNTHHPMDYNYDPSDLERYYRATQVIEATSQHQQSVAEQMKNLETSHAVEVFQKQLDLLKERLFNNPAMFRNIFIEEGIDAIANEFKKEVMTPEFIKKFWSLLLPGDAMSVVLMRFVWEVPLKFKRRFIHGIDQYLSDSYPMFKGLSQNWPSQNNIP